MTRRWAINGHDCPGGGDLVFLDDDRPEAEVPERTTCTVCDRDDVLVLGTYLTPGARHSDGWSYKLRAHKAKVIR
jgi:hypothetical protein